jgi:hypothetical protein
MNPLLVAEGTEADFCGMWFVGVYTGELLPNAPRDGGMLPVVSSVWNLSNGCYGSAKRILHYPLRVSIPGCFLEGRVE